MSCETSQMDVAVFKHVPETVGHDPLSFSKGAWPGSRDLVNLGALNANSSKTLKARDFKFDVHVSRDSPDMTP